jgi:hypothetical protein
MERFNLKNVNDVEIKEQSKVKIPSRDAVFGSLVDDEVGTNRAWEMLTENKCFIHGDSRL